MKKILLTIALLVSMPASADIQALAQDDDSIIYYDPSDVVLNQGLIYTSFITNYHGPQKAKLWGGMKIFNSTVSLIAFDCSRKLQQVVSISAYEGNYGRGRMVGAISTPEEDPTVGVWRPFPKHRQILSARILSRIKGVCPNNF